MRIFRRIIASALAVTVMLTFSGCWDYHEVESLFIVCGMAVDKGTTGHKYRLTLEMLNLSGGNGTNGNQKAELISAEGDTIADAAANASLLSENELYFSDCKITIFSREIAEEGLTSVLDWLNRDPQPRFTMQLYVSTAETAAELLEPEAKTEGAISPRVSEAIDQAASVGRSQKVCVYQADDVLLGEGKDLTLPCLERESSAEGVSKTAIDGTAVFQGDKLVGWRDEKQTRVDVFLTSRVKLGQLVVGINPSDREIALQVRDSNTKIKPVFGNHNQLSMNIFVEANCTFDEENTTRNLLADLGEKGIENLAEKAICARTEQEIHDVQAGLGCDIFGFGRSVYNSNPELWKSLKPHWRDTFRNVKVSISAKVRIGNTGFMYPKGKQQ